MLTMPQDANIPYEWQVGTERDKLIIIVPSWSQVEKTSYAVFMDKKTRELKCECKGFQIRGDCHHIRGLRWFCKMPRTRHRVQDTSLEAFRNLTKEMIGERQEAVLKAIEMLGPISDKQIATVLGWPINTITPRRGEIEDMGLIECSGEQLDEKTQRHEMTWSVV